jgi:hypothetical protein
MTQPSKKPEPGDISPLTGNALVPKECKPLANGRLRVIRSSESDIANLWAAVTITGTKWDDVLTPEFWSLHAHRLRVGDTVEIHTDDQRYFGRVLVRQVSGAGGNKTRASVAQLELHEFDRLKPSDDIATHRVEHKGPHLKWCVVRIADGKIVAEGHDTRDAAESAMKAIVRPAAT